MKKLDSNAIRQLWIDFFVSKQHLFLQSAPLIPINDRSLLWINSGVATLKKYFSGEDVPPCKRLTNSQKVIRTNDIANIGKTSRHHTFFEMLGNFSIGDYFKKEIISWAWEFLTSPKYLAIDPEKIYITVYEEDIDAYNLWSQCKKINLKHIFKCSKKTNFWDMGQGPCGPNTEIFYDRGDKFGSANSEVIWKDIENDRYIEIWNIVFSEFNNNGNGQYFPLPQKNIDTGAGFERIVAISQDAPTNFDSDLFLDLIHVIEPLASEKKYVINNHFFPQGEQTKINISYKIIVDHARSVIFAISDGAIPGNKERGYILRKLLRRAMINGIFLGINEPFLTNLVKPISQKMGSFFTNLKSNEEVIAKVIAKEEKQFFAVLKKSKEIFFNTIKNQNQLSALDAFHLFDTHGLPIDLIEDLCSNHNIALNMQELEKLVSKHIELSKRNQKFDIALTQQSKITQHLKKLKNEFIGYEKINIQSKCIFIFNETQAKKTLSLNDGSAWVIFDKTPFYAESGGQKHDIGTITSLDLQTLIEVKNVTKAINGLHLHKVSVIKGTLKINETMSLSVDKHHRELIENNHTATHIMGAALKKVLNEDIKQAGSYISSEGLRFDFATTKKIDNKVIIEVNKLVNKWIEENPAKEEFILTIDEAKKANITMNFEEKYGQSVRAIKYGDISSELCGGTHTSSLANIEQFEIIHFENKGSGIYRLEALTTKKVILNYYANNQKAIKATLQPLYNDLREIFPEVKSGGKKNFLPIVPHVIKHNNPALNIIPLMQKRFLDKSNKEDNYELIFLTNFYLLQLNSESYEVLSRLLSSAHLFSNKPIAKKYQPLLSYFLFRMKESKTFPENSLLSEYHFLSYLYLLTYKFDKDANIQDFFIACQDFLNNFNPEENLFLYQFLYQTNPRTFEKFMNFKKLTAKFQNNAKKSLLQHQSNLNNLIIKNHVSKIIEEIYEDVDKLIVYYASNELNSGEMLKKTSKIVSSKFPNKIIFLINESQLFVAETSVNFAKVIDFEANFKILMEKFGGTGGGNGYALQGKFKTPPSLADIKKIFLHE